MKRWFETLWVLSTVLGLTGVGIMVVKDGIDRADARVQDATITGGATVLVRERLNAERHVTEWKILHCCGMTRQAPVTRQFHVLCKADGRWWTGMVNVDWTLDQVSHSLRPCTSDGLLLAGDDLELANRISNAQMDECWDLSEATALRLGFAP